LIKRGRKNKRRVKLTAAALAPYPATENLSIGGKYGPSKISESKPEISSSLLSFRVEWDSRKLTENGGRKRFGTAERNWRPKPGAKGNVRRN